jgi:tetratricopeptide (TPR) repeat protein
MERGATTRNSVSARRSRSEARSITRRGALLRLRLLAALAVLATSSGAAAQPAELLYEQGAFEAAYDAAIAIPTAAMQLLAARAALDHAVYRLASSGASLDEQLTWLRRGLSAADKAAALDPASAPAVVQQARARGEIARRTGVLRNLDVAPQLRELFDRALALDPDDADALVGLAMWHLELVERGVAWLYGGDRNAILPLLERGVAAAPEQLNLRVEYATALRALGREEAARDQLQIALALPLRNATDAFERQRAEAMLRD